MDIGLTIAGGLCALITIGHSIASVPVLAAVPDPLGATRFGDGRFTRQAVVFTFISVSVLLATTAAVLFAVAAGDPGDHRTVVLAVGGGYAAQGIVEAWMERRHLTRVFRSPPFLLSTLIAVTCVLSA